MLLTFLAETVVKGDERSLHLKTQSPRFAIIPERDLLANDTKAIAVQGCRKPIAPLGFLGWASGRG